MDLLLKREQKASSFSLIPPRIGKGVAFSLRASIVLTPEENDLLNHYKLASAALVESSFIDDIKTALRMAVMMGILVFIVAFIFLSVMAAITLSLLAIAILTFVYFQKFRETIYVSDLLNNGRQFECHSIVELIHKEHFLEGVSRYLRQVLESAKNWNEREIIPIQALEKDLAKLAILNAK
jgi:hypothetical protein